jgi:hypothetical protein
MSIVGGRQDSSSSHRRIGGAPGYLRVCGNRKTLITGKLAALELCASAPSDGLRARTHGCDSALDAEAFEQYTRRVVERRIHPIGSTWSDVHVIDPDADSVPEHASILNLAAQWPVLDDATTGNQLHHFSSIGCIGRCPIWGDYEQLRWAGILALDQNLFD